MSEAAQPSRTPVSENIVRFYFDTYQTRRTEKERKKKKARPIREKSNLTRSDGRPPRGATGKASSFTPLHRIDKIPLQSKGVLPCTPGYAILGFLRNSCNTIASFHFPVSSPPGSVQNDHANSKKQYVISG